jgi:CheY-like chemotaxis protein
LKKYNSSITVITANNLHESDALLKNFLPDAIFLDMYMPGINGIEALKRIKEIPDLRDARLYMYSAFYFTLEEKEALELGALRWIKKPDDFEAYQGLFKELFEQK